MRRCKYESCPYYTNDERCYYHEKKRSGLFTDRPQRARHTVRASAVIDDEQREIADTLEALGADAHQVKVALTRKHVLVRTRRRR